MITDVNIVVLVWILSISPHLLRHFIVEDPKSWCCLACVCLDGCCPLKRESRKPGRCDAEEGDAQTISNIMVMVIALAHLLKYEHNIPVHTLIQRPVF